MVGGGAVHRNRVYGVTRPDQQVHGNESKCLLVESTLQAPRGTAFKQVSATFTGTFTWDGKIRLLQVEKIQELTVAPRDSKPRSKAAQQPQ